MDIIFFYVWQWSNNVPKLFIYINNTFNCIVLVCVPQTSAWNESQFLNMDVLNWMKLHLWLFTIKNQTKKQADIASNMSYTKWYIWIVRCTYKYVGFMCMYFYFSLFFYFFVFAFLIWIPKFVLIDSKT